MLYLKGRTFSAPSRHHTSRTFSVKSNHSGTEPLGPWTLSSASCWPLSSRFSRRSALFTLRGRTFSVPSRHPRGRTFSVPSRHSGTEPFFPLFCSLSALFPLLSLLLSQVALRPCHFELCIRSSTPLPIRSTLCLTIPGPAECAKRLNKSMPWKRQCSSRTTDMERWGQRHTRSPRWAPGKETTMARRPPWQGDHHGNVVAFRNLLDHP